MSSPWLLGAYTAGIILAVNLPAIAGYWLWLITAGLSASWLALRHSAWSWLPILLATVLTAYLLTVQMWTQRRPMDHINRFADDQPVIVEAKLLAAEATAENGYRLLTEARRVFIDRQTAPVSGKLLLFASGGHLSAKTGQVIRVRCRIRQPRRFGTPGEFNYPLYLAASEIFATASIEDCADLTVMAQHPDSSKIFWETARSKVAQQIEKSVPEQHVGLVQALVVGMRGHINTEQRDIISHGGIAHLFAISGLHFGLLALFLFHLCSWCYRRSITLLLWMPPQRFIPPLLLPPLFAYLMLSGHSWATQRAFLMFAVTVLLLIIRRHTSRPSLLASVALLLLVINPLALYQPGFQLSFAGLAGILCLLPNWQRGCADWPLLLRGPLLLLMTTTAATLATAPLVLWHFHYFAPAGLLANLLALPLVAWGAVPAGLFGTVCTTFAPQLAELSFQICAWLISLALDWASWLLQCKGLQAQPLYITAAEMFCITGLTSCLLLWKWLKPYRFLPLGLVVSVCVLTGLAQPGNTGLRITALSVGQGDAILLSFDNDRHFLVDGGGLPGSSIDTGSRLVAPALGRLGVRSLESVILTHAHPDHWTGLAYILKTFPVKDFWSAIPYDYLPATLKQELEQKQIVIHNLTPGWTRILAQGAQALRLFVPNQENQNVNERSVAVFASDQQNNLLLTGDLGLHGLQQLKNANLPAAIGLLQIPHHGSRNSAPGEYLKRFKSTVAFVSAGHNNRYGFPHPEALNACQKRNVRLLRTDQLGSLAFRSTATGWAIHFPAKAFPVD